MAVYISIEMDRSIETDASTSRVVPSCSARHLGGSTVSTVGQVDVSANENEKLGIFSALVTQVLKHLTVVVALYRRVLFAF